MQMQPVFLDMEVPPTFFVGIMFQNTDPKGNLYLKHWYDLKKEDGQSQIDCVCTLTWNQNHLLELIRDYQTLYGELEEIAPHLEELDGYFYSQGDICFGILEPDVLQTYLTYVAPFTATQEEELTQETAQRIGNRLWGFELIRHARRLCRLLQVNAPKTILEREGRMLIAAMAVNRFGTSTITVPTL